MIYRKFTEIIWNVEGTNQHGEAISFDVETEEEALTHQKRYDRLGGNVVITKMKYSSPKATWVKCD